MSIPQLTNQNAPLSSGSIQIPGAGPIGNQPVAALTASDTKELVALVLQLTNPELVRFYFCDQVNFDWLFFSLHGILLF